MDKPPVKYFSAQWMDEKDEDCSEAVVAYWIRNRIRNADPDPGDEIFIKIKGASFFFFHLVPRTAFIILWLL